MQNLQQQILVFDGFTLNLTRGCLLGMDRQEIKLRPKSFEVLKYLAHNSDRLVSKDELMSAVWPNTAVTDDSLVQCLIEVRRALSDSEQRIVKTVPRRGYVFQSEVLTPDLTDGKMVLTEEVAGVKLVFETEKDEQELSTADFISSRSTNARGLLRYVDRHKSMTFVLVATIAAAIITSTFIIPRYFRKSASDKTGSVASIRSIAVLPLENLSGDPAQEYFADGMTESLINRLAQIHALRVISRSSVMRYKGTNKSLSEIARELSVDAVITGSVRRLGGRVRVTTQLIHAATDAHLWARDYERDLMDVLKLESDIARSVANELYIELTAEERSRLAARRVNPEAHEAYLLGRYHFSKDTEADFRQAIVYFKRAIELEPNYAAAYVGLSNATLFLGLIGAEDIKEVHPTARAAAVKAVELDDQLAQAHLSLARIKQHYDWDWAAAEVELKRALELAPGSFDVHTDYGYLLMNLGRLDEAIREAQIAVQLDPVSSLTRSALGRFFYRAHKYDEALVQLEKAVELEPRSAHANYRLADLYAQLGRYAEAIALYEKVREVSPKAGNPQAAIARVYVLMGRRREARQMIQGLHAAPHVLASVYVALGDKDKAIRILEQTVAAHEFALPLKAEPPLESLYSDSRYQALLRRMNLPTE